MTKPAAACEVEADDDVAPDDKDASEFGDGDGGEDESSHSQGETFFYGGRAAWCADHEVAVIDNPEGTVGVYLPGEGFVSLHDFYKRMPKPGRSNISRVK